MAIMIIIRLATQGRPAADTRCRRTSTGDCTPLQHTRENYQL